MSGATFDALVIGTGLAGMTAAARLAEAGLAVAVADAGPASSSQWSGIGDVFGPSTPAPPLQLVSRLRRGASAEPGPELLDPQRRLDRLFGIAPSHPYVLLGLDAASLRALVERAVAALGVPGRLHVAPPLVPTLAGTMRRGDFVCDGVACVGDEAQTFVGLESLPQWSSDWAAQLARANTGGAHAALWSDALGDTPVASALSLASRWSEDPARCRGRIVDALSTPAGIMPGVLGATFGARAEADADFASSGVSVGELAGAFDSVFGVRLARHLAVRRHSLADVSAVTALPAFLDGFWRVETATGTVRARALIVAAGSPASRAARIGWLAAWMPAQPRPSRNTADSPWSRQPFLNRGVEVDSRLQVRGADGPAFACGLCVDGHDSAHDGSAFGVALATGIRAAEHAIEELT